MKMALWHYLAHLEKSIEDNFILGGVPVFNLPILRPSPFMESLSIVLGNSPTLPPEVFKSPVCIKPFKKVPVVITTAFDSINAPASVLIPIILLPFTSIAPAGSEIIVKLV